MTSPVDRAVALQRLADRAGTPAEARAAARALSKHLAAHRLKMGELEEKTPVTFGDKALCEGARIAPWRYNLVCGLCRLYGTAPYIKMRRESRLRRGRKRRRCVRFIMLCGIEADIERVTRLFRQFAADVERLGSEHEGDRRSFRLGLVEGLLTSARAGAREAEEAATTAMVHVGGRYDAALAHLRDKLKINGPKAVDTWSEQGSYKKGYDQGRKMHVGDRLADTE